MANVSRAASALKRLLTPQQPSINQSDLAKQLDVTPQAVSAWVRGETRPAAHLRDALERIYSIPADDWMTAKERKIAQGDAPSESSLPDDADHADTG